MRPDYLYGTEYLLEQPLELYHFNSDTEILGHFMHVKKTDSVLDIGCGTGALLCYAHRFHPRKLTGIDLYEEVVSCARENMKRNAVDAEIICADVRTFMHEPFDVIVCNPPFFHTGQNGYLNENKWIRAARHDLFLNLNELFEHASRLLKDDGRFYLITLCTRMNEVFRETVRFDLSIRRMRIAYRSADKPARTAVMEITRQTHSEMQIEAPILLNERNTYAKGD